MRARTDFSLFPRKAAALATSRYSSDRYSSDGKSEDRAGTTIFAVALDIRRNLYAPVSSSSSVIARIAPRCPECYPSPAMPISVRQQSASALEVAIGERLRELRQERGARQEDVAARAREIGLTWSRATVALLEAGRRQLSVGEFLLLPFVLTVNDAHESPRLADFFVREGSVWLVGDVKLPSSALRTLLQGRSPRRTTSLPAGLPGVAKRTSTEPGDLETAEKDALGDAEQKAARKLGIAPISVAIAARKLWGRTLTAERDRQISEKTPEAVSPRTLQALRGHVSRLLTAKLSTVVATTGAGKIGRVHLGNSPQIGRWELRNSRQVPRQRRKQRPDRRTSTEQG